MLSSQRENENEREKNVKKEIKNPRNSDKNDCNLYQTPTIDRNDNFSFRIISVVFVSIFYVVAFFVSFFFFIILIRSGILITNLDI